jgi:hypothetical protein
MLLRMGPVRFAGKVKMTDIRPPEGYTLTVGSAAARRFW